jgi:ADP-ribose pyrophosphatase YjhB (NUDIX family)
MQKNDGENENMKELRLVKAIVRYNSHPSTLENARYLLLQKAKDKFFHENVGKWECPGSLVEKEEISKQAIMREIKEETGLEGRIVKQLPTIRMTDEQYDSRCDVYLINSASMDVKLNKKEHLDYAWMKSTDVKNMNLVLYASLLLEFFNNPKKYLD